ncbi:monovalent cation/H+ antiporter subunit D family protein [Microcella alkaliphila]|uniref:NADH-Ubiquinone/plastoquinone (Complex I), vario us chains family protein n=1 Tax=Microcella alkaliphila TaxID=279828 RepID=A0A0U5BC38_9MICO|nr:monovalent cation/H+ antiporter subunit D family protein [Microcella alkaliphila]BAU32209.1 NADH-Ubiquinone/plastoquinone (Complex I), vario us chains family protein [Microcella alkaliphila]
MTDVVSLLLPLFAGAPLLVGGILLALPRQHVLRSVLGMVSLLAMLAGSVLLVVLTADGSVIAHQVALWPGGISIPFVADLFASLVLTVTSILAVVSFQYMIASGEAQSPSIASFVLILAGGVAGALLTGDLFNLFVFIEVMLLPSYGLLLVLSRQGDLGGARLYVTVNLLASTLFLGGVGLIYAVEGTVNLAELAGAAAENPATAVAAAVCLGAIAVKAAVFPVHGWLARTYVVTSPAVTALFSGLHTKVAIYVIYRIYAVVFDGDATWLVIALVITSLTMVIGVFGAMGEPTMRAILVFHMVSQIGYILVGVGLFTQLGLTAGIFYLLHHMIVKASLFLSTGALEQTYGSGRLDRLGGMRTREPLVTAAFVIAALSLAGLPPFSGFVAKFSLILATIDAGQVVVGIVAIVVSLFTLLSMMKIWAAVFNGKLPQDSERLAAESRVRNREGLLDDEPADGTAVDAEVQRSRERDATRWVAGREDAHDHHGPRVPLRLALPALQLAVITICLGIGAEFLLGLSQQAAAGLLDTTSYITAVIGG